MEETSSPGSPTPNPSPSVGWRWPWQKKKPELQKLPEGTPLTDIIAKMLTDEGCTVNKIGVEKVANYFIATCLEMVSDNKSYLDKIKDELEEERNRWSS